MRTKVQVDEIRCDRCDAAMKERQTDLKARALATAAVLETGRDPQEVDLCAACEKRVLQLGLAIRQPRKRRGAA